MKNGGAGGLGVWEVRLCSVGRSQHGAVHGESQAEVRRSGGWGGGGGGGGGGGQGH